ncbi:EpsD family peptidyl-prolyl cis-trans isomerase [Novosphingobium piscinae]|uniref:peptidylprolyl isomerase n=1 Tax=Novosphingobium piscinae TaxID=1507448 RepID=A0A7X1FW84_9SPHN|nr:EpsD family peptidyl-prolyl cis-trans isomerase [Novosphingobium piscinae]MBC2668138.1 peptidyl-prolyl cis-trans isomerase, EpsD family [Novosphingobium piscinae]
MRTTKGTLIAGGALALLALAGCKREATGQVAAVVNGEEVTLAELNQELQEARIPAGADKKAVQARVLQTIIDRRLIAQAARQDGIDKQPEYLNGQRKADELLLIQLFTKKLNQAALVPDNAAIDKYMAANPTLFGQRTVYRLDRIEFPVPSDMTRLQEIKNDHSLDAVAARLTAMGIKFDRGEGALDSAQLPAQAMNQIKALPPTEPFVIPGGKGIIVAVIKGSETRPFDGPEARTAALQRMRMENLDKTLGDRLKTVKASAKIEYQNGFAPPAAAPAK